MQVQERSYEIPHLSKTLADIQQTKHHSEPGPRAPTNLTQVLHWISHCLASCFLLNPTFKEHPLTVIMKFPKNSKTVAPKCPLFPNVPCLARGTVVSSAAGRDDRLSSLGTVPPGSTLMMGQQNKKYTSIKDI